MDHQELQQRQSELQEPQLRKTEAQETVMKCKGSAAKNQLKVGHKLTPNVIV